MNIGVYQGASALSAYEKWQEVISQNIAYGSMPGFKKSEVSFESINGSNTKLGGQGKLGDDIHGVMPKVGSRINFTPGTLQHSDNQLDFAIQGDGFFQIQRPNGKLGYTRDGEFHLSPDRTLVTKQGGVVMGEGGPIAFKEGGGDITISADGIIKQGGEELGKLTVHNFKDLQGLHRVGDGLFAPVDEKVQPQPVEKPEILSGFLESSNVSPLTEMVNLITVSRAYEASKKVISGNDDNTDKAIETLGSPPAS